MVLATAHMAGCECRGASGGSLGGSGDPLPESARMALCAIGITVSFLFYGAPHLHLLLCHSFSHTNLKSPCVEQGMCSRASQAATAGTSRR